MGVVAAVLLAAVLAAAAGPILRWCPHPEPEASFDALLSPAFRVQLGGAVLAAATLSFLLTPPAQWLSWAAWAGPGVLLGLVDLRTSYLPTRLVGLGSAVAIVGAVTASVATASWMPLLTAVAGGMGAAGFFWLLWRLSAGQLGFGDVRLAGLIGLSVGVVGPTLVWWALFLGALIGAIWGLLARWRRGTDGAFPYGPALLLGPALALGLSPWLLPG